MDKMSIKEVVWEAAQEAEFDKITMRRLRTLTMPRVIPLTPKQIKAIRSKNHVSQAVMAALLNVNPTTIQKWERGDTKPEGAALKLLHIVKTGGLETLTN